MARKTVLFLCTGNYFRGRYAESLFNAVAEKQGLAWRATSRGLALERGVGNVGPMAPSAIKRLEGQGVRAIFDFARFPMSVTADDFTRAGLIVALKHAEHLPLMQERHPEWCEKLEYWHIDDALEALELIDREIQKLAVRFGADREKPKSGPTVRVGRETKGRRGKGVTLIWDVPLDEAGLQELATKLKNRCGTGGTVKDGQIEIQGDQRERITTELESLGYKVKRVGG